MRSEVNMNWMLMGLQWFPSYSPRVMCLGWYSPDVVSCVWQSPTDIGPVRAWRILCPLHPPSYQPCQQRS